MLPVVTRAAPALFFLVLLTGQTGIVPGRGSLPPGSQVGVGAGGASGSVCGTLFTDFTDRPTTITTEEHLVGYTLPADTLNVDGRGLSITAWGTTAANANTKALRIYFGGTGGTGGTIIVNASAAVNNGSIHVSANLIRRGASAWDAHSLGFTSTGTLALANGVRSTNAAQAFNAARQVSVRSLTGTAAGDFTLRAVIIKCF